MKKLFISQPMANLTEEQIRKARQHAIEEIGKIYGEEEVEVIDSIITDETEGKGPIWFLGKSIELMAEADLCVFLDGWADARGCRVEHLVAEEYGVEIVDMASSNKVSKIGFYNGTN